MKLILILTFLIFSFYNLFSINDLSLKGGVLFTADRDLVWSPVLTNTFTPTGEISYKIGREKGFNELNCFFSMGDIMSPISSERLFIKDEGRTYTRTDTLIISDLDYTYFHRTLDHDDFSLYLGIGIEFDFQMILGYYPLANATTSLNLGAKIQKTINGHRFGTSLLIPVVTYLNRPPYTGTDDEIMDMASNNIGGLITRGELSSIHEYLNIDFNFNYQYSLTENLGLNTAFNIGYSRVRIPRDKWLLETSILVGLTYSFEGEKK